MYIDERSPYLSSKNDALVMIQVTDTFFEKDRKPVSFHENSFQRHEKALFDELHACCFELNKENFLTLALLLDPNVQQPKIISYLLKYPLISLINLLDDNKRHEPNKWELNFIKRKRGVC